MKIKLATLAVATLTCFVLSLTVVRVLSEQLHRDSLVARQTIKDELRLIDSEWCWRTLCPGRVTVTDFVNQLKRWGFHDDLAMTWTSSTLPKLTVSLVADISQQSSDPLVQAIILQSKDSAIRLGDALVEFGVPSNVSASQNQFRQTWQLRLCFANKICVSSQAPFNRLDPKFEVNSLMLGDVRITRAADAHWQGFALLPFRN